MSHLTKQQKHLMKAYPAGSSRVEMVRVARVELGDEQAEVLRTACELTHCPECAGYGRDPWATYLPDCWLCEGSGLVTRDQVEQLAKAKEAA